jgi:hypothetical protein
MTEIKTTPSSNAIIIERLNALACDTAEIKNKLDKHEEAQNNFRIDYEIRHAAIEKKSDTAHLRLDETNKRMERLEQEINALKEAVRPLVLQAKILGWLAIALGSSVVALIWGILIHKITISVP